MCEAADTKECISQPYADPGHQHCRHCVEPKDASCAAQLSIFDYADSVGIALLPEAE